MTAREFVRELCKLAQAQERAVSAIDFEPSKDGLRLTFRFRG